MNKYIVLSSLIGCLATSQAADDKIRGVQFSESANILIVEPSIGEMRVTSERFFAAISDTQDLPVLTDADIRLLYKIHSTLSRITNSPAPQLKAFRSAYIDSNLELPRFMFSSDIMQILGSQILELVGNNDRKKEFTRITWTATSTGIKYPDSRISGLGNIIPVLEYLASRSDVIAIDSITLPNTVEGTTAAPKIDVRYEFYQIPPVLMMVLSKFSHFEWATIIREMGLEKLSYSKVATLIGNAVKWKSANEIAAFKKENLQLPTIFSQYTASKESQKGKKLSKKTLRKNFDASVAGFLAALHIPDVSELDASQAPQAPAPKKRRSSSITRKAVASSSSNS